MSEEEPETGEEAPEPQDTTDEPDLAEELVEEEEQNRATPPIVGIGASAGGVDAFQRLFPAVAPDSGLAFVVVQHLDPKRHSALSEVLGRTSKLPVLPIEDDMLVQANHVYVIPPNVSLGIERGRLQFTDHVALRAKPDGIDDFFLALARDQAENAACVILSGTGSDGTVGLRAIKEAGGLTIAQADAAYNGMMRSAVATGMVDFILPAEQIAPKLGEYFSFARQMRREKSDKTPADAIGAHMEALMALLRNQTGHDFSGYKDKTIVRRVQRRMHVLQITDPGAFIERLRSDAHELMLLFQDLLIGVTEFFRDHAAFEALKQKVIPELFKGKASGDAIRVWVPGCSTGEEAYSIAILLREAAASCPVAVRLQVFASDIDARALEVARLGRYPASIAKDMPPDLLARYFIREDGSYRIAGELREVCLFSTHNLLRDAPFSRQDLISCRNLLIYLNNGLQAQVIPLFHYALNLNGFLFLGTSENVTRHARLFSTVDKAHRIFQRRTHIERRLPEFPLSMPDVPRREVVSRPHRGAAEPSLRNVAEGHLLDRFVPAYVVINADGDVLQSSGRTGKYLELPAGAPDTNVFSMARTGLRLELRATLHKAVGSGRTAMQPRVLVGTNGGRQEIDLYIQPIRFGNPAETLYMVVFQDIGSIQPGLDTDVLRYDTNMVEIDVNKLETELRATRERLQATAEELESSNEELKSSNEELSSMNEELQSANEELETSKEELQSINEELHTVNSELNARVEELSRSNDDMSNLLNSTQIATVFLDRSLLVKGFTPAAKDVFRLVESDTGRPIMHVQPRFVIDDLQADAERVLRTLATIERPVKSNENDTLYMMRMLPYRTTDNVISGIAMTFIDITRVFEAESQVQELTLRLRARIQDLETVIDLVPVGVLIAEDAKPERILVNRYGARMLGYQDGRKGAIPLDLDIRVYDGNNELPQTALPIFRALQTGQPVPTFEARLEHPDGNSVDVMLAATPLFDHQTAVRGAIGSIVNISAHKKFEAEQRVLLDELQHRVKNILATVYSLAIRMSRRSPSMEDFKGSFLDRLAAMGRMHDLLSGGAWEGVELRSLLSTALDSYANGNWENIVMNGLPVRLMPNAATTLGMVFHELATNAAKYGALTSENGVVDVSWLVRSGSDDERSLQIDWVERNGPPVAATATEGFGTGFVRRSVEYELEGTARLQLRPEGVVCNIAFPLRGNTETEPDEGDAL